VAGAVTFAAAHAAAAPPASSSAPPAPPARRRRRKGHGTRSPRPSPCAPACPRRASPHVRGGRGGRGRAAAGADAAVALVSLPLPEDEGTLGLRAGGLTPVLQGGGRTEVWSLVVKPGGRPPGRGARGFTISRPAGYAPAFVRGAALRRLRPLPAGVKIAPTSAVLSALRRAAAGERSRCCSDGAQAGRCPPRVREGARDRDAAPRRSDRRRRPGRRPPAAGAVQGGGWSRCGAARGAGGRRGLRRSACPLRGGPTRAPRAARRPTRGRRP